MYDHVIETTTHESSGFRVTRFYDDEPPNPRANFDCDADVAVVVHDYGHGRSSFVLVVGDTRTDLSDAMIEAFEHFQHVRGDSSVLTHVERYLAAFHDAVLVRQDSTHTRGSWALYGAMSRGAFEARFAGAAPDADVTPESCAQGAVEMVRQYFEGEVYGVEVTDPVSGESSSLSGIYGLTDDYFDEVVSDLVEQVQDAAQPHREARANLDVALTQGDAARGSHDADVLLDALIDLLAAVREAQREGVTLSS